MKKTGGAKKLNFIDLFAGCGGLSEGFMHTGKFEPLAHVEWELPMVNTLRNRLVTKYAHSENDAVKRVVHFDIQRTDELLNGGWSDEAKDLYSTSNHAEIIAGGLKGLIGEKRVDVIIGGPPCQAYSIAGRAQDPNSMVDDYRNYLFEAFAEVVKSFQPEVFVFENVPGLLSAKPGGKPVKNRIFDAFRDIGYSIQTPEHLQNSIVNTADYGVPQKRRRLLIIGVKSSSLISHNRIEELLHDLRIPEEKQKTVFDAIGKLPKLLPKIQSERVAGRNVSHALAANDVKLPGHYPRYHNKRDISIFREWVKAKMNRLSTIEKLDFYNKVTGKHSNHAKYRSLDWDKPSPTIVAHLYKDGLMFIHPDENQARSITVLESALLQSFPVDFDFLGSQASCYKMIGNAVPPVLAESIAKAVDAAFREREAVVADSALEEMMTVEIQY